ncbi:hypothetical protein BaRGS_00010704 [Batillaria attramentaria]|uniref:Uncharacterized protein n=1 Tax=Batillaria attramentaria TaxID=370345 RepID=A0ABD0LF57_9CAEN
MGLHRQTVSVLVYIVGQIQYWSTSSDRFSIGLHRQTESVWVYIVRQNQYWSTSTDRISIGLHRQTESVLVCIVIGHRYCMMLATGIECDVWGFVCDQARVLYDTRHQ